jgi:hypothetical protein
LDVLSGSGSVAVIVVVVVGVIPSVLGVCVSRPLSVSSSLAPLSLSRRVARAERDSSAMMLFPRSSVHWLMHCSVALECLFVSGT